MYYSKYVWEEPKDVPVQHFYDLVEGTERQTHRIVTIDTRPTAENLAKCDPQLESPFFKLPAELRSAVFEYACLPYDDENDRYDGHSCHRWRRPGHEARHLTSTSLLLTCRRAWLEANHLPFRLGDHSFWFGGGRRPHYLRGINPDEDERLERFLSGLTFNNRENLKHIHLYAETTWLQEFSGSKCVQALNIAGVCPEILTITIRASDWLGWERHGAPPQLRNDTWLEKILQWPALPRLREIRLELEAGERIFEGVKEQQVPELERIEADLRRKFAIIKRVDHFGTPAKVVLDNPVGVSLDRTWSGVALQKESAGIRGQTMYAEFTIKTLVWKVALDREIPLGSSHLESTPPPILHVDGSCEASNSPWFLPLDKELLSKIEQEWCMRGSLLKFASGAYTMDYYGWPSS